MTRDLFGETWVLALGVFGGDGLRYFNVNGLLCCGESFNGTYRATYSMSSLAYGGLVATGYGQAGGRQLWGSIL